MPMAKQNGESTDRDILNRILSILEKQGKPCENALKNRVYDNQAIMELLNIKHKYLKMLRDKGFLGYSRCGDKYWYSQSDVDLFLSRFHYEAFATPLSSV